jgi:hypothetical protein
LLKFDHILKYQKINLLANCYHNIYYIIIKVAMKERAQCNRQVAGHAFMVVLKIMHHIRRKGTNDPIYALCSTAHRR